MALKRFLDRFTGSKHRPGSAEQRYDNVEVIRMADSPVIKGHDAVKAHFERERKMLDAYGSNIIFQVHRINLQAHAIEELVGEQLAEITVPGDFVSGTDTVAAVKARLCPLLEGKAKEGTPSNLSIAENDRFTLFFSGRPMLDDKLFYADHFMMLPAWVQVQLHGSEFEEVMELAAKLRQQG